MSDGTLGEELSPPLPPFDVGIIGAGPAGLMAAEVLTEAGWRVCVFDASASAGRKFLLAGKGGLNLTHSEALPAFIQRYYGGGPDATAAVSHWLHEFGPEALRAWCHALGIETFVGSSGRVFPRDMKSAPLLRAWLHRLRSHGVRFAMRHRWEGWRAEGVPKICHQGLPIAFPTAPKAWILATGGGSWPHLGSDGAWQAWLRESGVSVKTLQASNCGFDVGITLEDGTVRSGWSPHLQSRFSGAALKNISATIREADWTQAGELLISTTGIEGNLVYAASARLREQLLKGGMPPQATLWINLLPAFSADKILREVSHPRGARSWSSHLKSRLGLEGLKMALLHELMPKSAWQDETQIAQYIGALPIRVTAMRPLAEAISSAGGVSLDAVKPTLELKALPGVFCAGEMLDWDAPTGGYLLTACMASGRLAGRSAAEYCQTLK